MARTCSPDLYRHRASRCATISERHMGHVWRAPESRPAHPEHAQMCPHGCSTTLAAYSQQMTPSGSTHASEWAALSPSRSTTAPLWSSLAAFDEHAWSASTTAEDTAIADLQATPVTADCFAAGAALCSWHLSCMSHVGVASTDSWVGALLLEGGAAGHCSAARLAWAPNTGRSATIRTLVSCIACRCALTPAHETKHVIRGKLCQG